MAMQAQHKDLAAHYLYLLDRWQDEKEYEDFDDYKKSMLDKIKELDANAKLLVMNTKQCVFMINGDTFRFYIKGSKMFLGKMKPIDPAIIAKREALTAHVPMNLFTNQN